MSAPPHQRQPFDLQSYRQRVQAGACFICALVSGDEEEARHSIVYQDELAIAFLNKYPTLYGYTLVAPRRHLDQVTADFTLDRYLALQRVVYLVAEAIRQEVPTERMYILSLGSKQGNSHVHWHVAPLPPGVPFEEQQLQALDLAGGVLSLSEQETAHLATRLRARLAALVERVPL